MGRLIAGLLLVAAMVTTGAGSAFATETNLDDGAALFAQHCSGCHINGGNIIRRSKNLKLATLQRRGLDSVDAIARIANEGVGQMSGYGEVLGDGGDQIVATWVLQQAQNAWIQG